jgi:hypothetical protein
MIRRWAFAAFWLVVALYVIRHPAPAGHAAAAIAHALITAADALGRFAASL